MEVSVNTQQDIILEYNTNNNIDNSHDKIIYNYVPDWQCNECTITNILEKCILCGCNSPNSKLKPKKLFYN